MLAIKSDEISIEMKFFTPKYRKRNVQIWKLQ